MRQTSVATGTSPALVYVKMDSEWKETSRICFRIQRCAWSDGRKFCDRAAFRTLKPETPLEPQTGRHKVLKLQTHLPDSSRTPNLIETQQEILVEVLNVSLNAARRHDALRSRDAYSCGLPICHWFKRGCNIEGYRSCREVLCAGYYADGTLAHFNKTFVVFRYWQENGLQERVQVLPESAPRESGVNTPSCTLGLASSSPIFTA